MFRILLEHLSSRDQKTVMESALHMLSKYFSDLAPSEYSPGWPQRDSVLVSAVAKFIDMTFGHEETGRSHLMSWLNNTSGARIGDGIGISRAVLPILSKNKFIIETVFDKSLKQFEDQLYIRHTPILQQEGDKYSSSQIQ
jgi:telomere length regulation protein